MKKIIRLLYVLLAVVILSACTDGDRGKVVSQDVSYQPDADYIYVDIPEEFPFAPANILYLQGTTILKLNGTYDGEHLTIAEGTEFTFNVGLKKALNEDILVSFKYASSLLDEYQNMNNLHPFPEGNLPVFQGKVAAGTQEGKITLTLQNIDALNEAPGYILPLQLEFINPVDGLKVSSDSYSVFIELKVGKDNIDPSNAQIKGVLFNDNVFFGSDSPGLNGLEVLNDGKVDPWDRSGWWYPDSKSTYLSMYFSEPVKVLGIKIDVTTGYYQLEKFNVYADEGNGFIPYGTVDRDTKGAPFYVRFKNPVEVRGFKFDEMLSIDTGNGDVLSPEFTEITFIREPDN